MYIENIVKPDPEDDNKIIQLPLQFDADKIILTDDGDVKMIEPENMQVEEKLLCLSLKKWRSLEREILFF